MIVSLIQPSGFDPVEFFWLKLYVKRYIKPDLNDALWIMKVYLAIMWNFQLVKT